MTKTEIRDQRSGVRRLALRGWLGLALAFALGVAMDGCMRPAYALNRDRGSVVRDQGCGTLDLTNYMLTTEALEKRFEDLNRRFWRATDLNEILQLNCQASQVSEILSQRYWQVPVGSLDAPGWLEPDRIVLSETQRSKTHRSRFKRFLGRR